jgi:hypothetical protein
MAGRHYNWHKRWRRDIDAHLVHESGVRVIVHRGEDYTDFTVDHGALEAYQAIDQARGVPLHVTLAKLKRLLAEARLWRDPLQKS